VDQRDGADLDAGHVGDRVPTAGSAVQRDAEIPRARTGLRRESAGKDEEEKEEGSHGFVAGVG
jgi:hypothetical protein